MIKNIVACFFLLFLSSCVTREDILATVWLNNFNNSMSEICKNNPEIANHGFFRKLNNGKIEFMSICNPNAEFFKAIPNDDFNRILDANLPKKPDPTI